MLFGPFGAVLFLIVTRHVLFATVTVKSIYPSSTAYVVFSTLHSLNVTVVKVAVVIKN